MSIYKINEIDKLIEKNEYVGRSIIVGLSEDGKSAVFAYAIMGRSENSRNRVFKIEKDEVVIYPFDYSKVEDPTLIIYSPVKRINNSIIVTNGDQTDTIFNFMTEGKTFEQALESRCFEPDAPNLTPRISGILNFENNSFSYKLSILKSGDEVGSVCNRYTFSYLPIKGLGHFIHTYNHNGDPIPTFTGEPERVKIENDINVMAEKFWNSLNEKNKISMYVEYVDLASHTRQSVLINKNK